MRFYRFRYGHSYGYGCGCSLGFGVGVGFSYVLGFRSVVVQFFFGYGFDAVSVPASTVFSGAISVELPVTIVVTHPALSAVFASVSG